MMKRVVFSFFLLLVAGLFAQAPGTANPGTQPTAKVIFYYGRPVPLKNCLVQIGIQIDGATVHQIFQWHVWQTDVAPGIHVFSDDSRREKGLTATLVAGQTYYFDIQWHKGFGLPKCDNFWTRVEDMKPKDIQKASALLGKPGIDETTAVGATQAVAVQPPPMSSSQKLLVESVPDRADIEVDGAFRGNTPSTVELTPGDHTVVVSKIGYKPWQRTIKLAGGDVKLSTELERAQ